MCVRVYVCVLRMRVRAYARTHIQSEHSTGCARSHVSLYGLGSTLVQVQVPEELVCMFLEADWEGLCPCVCKCG